MSVGRQFWVLGRRTRLCRAAHISCILRWHPRETAQHGMRHVCVTHRTLSLIEVRKLPAQQRSLQVEMRHPVER